MCVCVLFQDSPSTADTASAENSADFKTNELPEGGNETETVEKSSTGRDEEIKEDKSPTAAAAITAKTVRNAEKKKARKQKVTKPFKLQADLIWLMNISY